MSHVGLTVMDVGYPKWADRLMAGLMGVLLSCSLGAFAQDGAKSTWAPDAFDTTAVERVWTFLGHKDCVGAARALDEGVRDGHASVMLLAGAMFEEGICLKSNWPRAVEYYLRAHQAGHSRSVYRLVAGYAAAVGGPDPAAALWWALRAGQVLPGECRVDDSDRADPERFVAVLRAWPPARLGACVYVAGVLATMHGDLEFSRRAASYGLKGVVKVRYVPATGSLAVETDSIDAIDVGGVYSGDLLQDRSSRSARQLFERDVRAVADRALKRYTQPAGIDPTWQTVVEYIFTYE